MKNLCLIIFILTCGPLYAGEVLPGCEVFGKDIEYWQQQYSRLLKEKKKVEEELSEAQQKLAQIPSQVPNYTGDNKKDESTYYIHHTYDDEFWGEE